MTEKKYGFISMVRYQCAVQIRRKETVIVFYVVSLFVFMNFVTNVFSFWGKDVMEMYHPMKLLLLGSDSGAAGFYFLQCYPILVSIPAGFSFWKDRMSGEVVLQVARTNKKDYFFGKAAAVFLVSFCVFALPLLTEIALNCLAFPLHATGDTVGESVYDPYYIETVKQYMFSGLYIWSPYAYAIAFALLFGVISGVLGVLTMAVSTFPIRFRVILLMPAYFLLYGTGHVGKLLHLPFDTEYFLYLGMYSGGRLSAAAMFGLMAVLLLGSVGVIHVRAQEDLLR